MSRNGSARLTERCSADGNKARAGSGGEFGSVSLAFVRLAFSGYVRPELRRRRGCRVTRKVDDSVALNSTVTVASLCQLSPLLL